MQSSKCSLTGARNDRHNISNSLASNKQDDPRKDAAYPNLELKTATYGNQADALKHSPPCPFLLVCTEHSRLVHWVMLLPNWDLYLPCTDVDMLASSQAAVYQCFQKSCNTSWSRGMVAMQTLKCSHCVPPGSQQPWKNITQVSLEYHCVIPGGSETVTGTDTNCIVKLQGWIILNVSSQVKHIIR